MRYSNRTKFILNTLTILGLLLSTSAHANGLANFFGKIGRATKSAITRKAPAVTATEQSVARGGLGTLTQLKALHPYELSEKINDKIAKATDHVFRDLDLMITHSDPVPTLGREVPVENTLSALIAKDGSLLVGSLDGPNQVVSGLAERIHNGRVPEALSQSRLIEVNTANNIFNDAAKFKSTVVELNKTINAVDSSKALRQDSPLIFVFEQLEKSQIDSASSHAVNLSGHIDILQSVFPHRPVKIIFKVSGEQVDTLKTNYANLIGRLKEEAIKDFSDTEVMNIVTAHLPSIEREFNVVIPKSVVSNAVKWTKMYHADGDLLGSTIATLREAAALKLIRNSAPVSERLNALKNELNQYQMELGKLNHLVKANPEGASYAQLRLANLPDKIRQVQTEIRQESRAISNLTKLRDQQQTLTKEIDDAVARNDARNIGVLTNKKRKLEKALKEVTENDIGLQISRATGIKFENIVRTQKIYSYDEVRALIESRLYGQPEMVEMGVRIYIRALKTRLGEKKPVYSALIWGESGVGKTEYAKILQTVIYDSDESLMARIDMSELQDSSSITRIIGSDPKYVGYGEKNSLVHKVAQNNRRVVLFDETGREHSSITDLQLQILDEGRLTAGDGTVADFKASTVLGTTNKTKEELLQHFDIATLNRYDEIIGARSLEESALLQVAAKRLRKFNEILADDVMRVDLDKSANDAIVELQKIRGGAGRGMEKVLEQEVIARFDSIRYFGMYKNGAGQPVSLSAQPGDLIRVSHNETDGFVFRVIKRADLEDELSTSATH